MLCRALRQDFSYHRLILIFGVLRGKNYALMLKKLVPLADLVIITKPETERAVPPGELLELAGFYCDRVEIVAESQQALRRAIAVAAKEDLILVAGSLYLVGEIKQAFPALPRSPMQAPGHQPD
ncbi:MAG: hypothetical protein L7F78_02305 [Syntrophales bacterium LBB04]|nr:hypothetical protein [Syntrophales bacterium LBB04]